MSAKKYKVILSEKERDYLENYINKGHHPSRSIKRARVLLQASSGKTDTQIASDVGYKTPMSIYNIRRRYSEEGVEKGIIDKPRSGRPLRLNSRDNAHLTAIACSKAPDGRVRWTLRLLAKKLIELKVVDSICPATVGSELKKTS